MEYLTEYQWISSALGWTILHSLWQIALVGSLWFLAIAAFKKASSSTKYIFSIFAMLLIVLMTSMTFISEMSSRIPIADEALSEEISIQQSKKITEGNPSKAITNNIPTTEVLIDGGINSEIQSRQEWLSPEVLKLLSLVWICGVLFFGMRFLLQWFYMRKLAIKGTHPFDDERLTNFIKLKDQLGIKKKIRFLQSSLVASPLTFGHFKPVVLLPLGMINGFPPAQIEAIILHELAHIQRNDFLINTIQTWLEILFFYHPIVWIISKRIRSIREELCDDEVVRVNKNSMLYAESLVNLQKYFLTNKNKLVMNATGNKNELSNRIHRLFQPTPGLTKKKRNLNAYLFGLLMIVVMGSYAFSSFEYPTVSIAVDKMNVLYIGVNNPITVAVAGVSTENTKVESEDLIIEDLENGHFIVTASKPGVAKIKVTAKGHATKELEFRVKRIPDPVARLGKSQGGGMTAEAFMKHDGIDAIIDYFDFDATCKIMEFNMTYVAKKEDPVESINRGRGYSEKTKALVLQAKAGDIFYFDNVSCECPGDEEPRPINSMVFKMK